MGAFIRAIAGVLLALALTVQAQPDDFAARLAQGEQQSRTGQFYQAVEHLRRAYQLAASPTDKSRAANALGVATSACTITARPSRC